MSEVFYTIEAIVTDAQRANVNAALVALLGPRYPEMSFEDIFTTGFSATGSAPATHWGTVSPILDTDLTDVASAAGAFGSALTLGALDGAGGLPSFATLDDLAASIGLTRVILSPF